MSSHGLGQPRGHRLTQWQLPARPLAACWERGFLDEVAAAWECAGQGSGPLA